MSENCNTNEESAKKIIQSGCIRQSDPKYGDAIAGKGVYANQLPPSTPKKDILDNNYDGMSPINPHKADVAFEVKVPRERVEKVTTDRNVFKVEGTIKLDTITKIHDRCTGKTFKHPK